MKVQPINMIKYSPAFGDTNGDYSGAVKPLTESEIKTRAWNNAMKTLKQKKFSYNERMNFARELALDTLDDFVSEEYELYNLFDKLRYLIKRRIISKIRLY